MSDSDSEDDLLPPSQFFNRLLSSTPRREETRRLNQLSKSSIIDNPATPKACSRSTEDTKEGVRGGKKAERRRSSPRIASRKEPLERQHPSPSHESEELVNPAKGTLDDVVGEEDCNCDDSILLHRNLANELFPPSPPPPLPSSCPSSPLRRRQSPRSTCTMAKNATTRTGVHATRETSPSLISDSEGEREMNPEDGVNRRMGYHRAGLDRLTAPDHMGSDKSGGGKQEEGGTIVDDSEGEQETLNHFDNVIKYKTPRKKLASVSTSTTTLDLTSTSSLNPRPERVSQSTDATLNLTESLDQLTLNVSTFDNLPIPTSVTPRVEKGTRSTCGSRRKVRNSSSSSEERRVGEEVTIVETDNEEEGGVTEGMDRDSMLPVLEPDFGFTMKKGDSEGLSSRGGSFQDEDDVFENDGMLIYEPTPKKRPTKLSRPIIPKTPSHVPTRTTLDLDSPSSSSPSTPKRPTSTVPKLKSALKTPRNFDLKRWSKESGEEGEESRGRRVEIDLTESSSGEEEGEGDIESDYLPLPRTFDSNVSKPTTPKRPAPPRRPKTSKPTPSRTKGSSTSTSSSLDPLLTPSSRLSLPLSLIKQLDILVFRKRWSGLTCLDGEGEFRGDGLPEGLKVVWNARLRNTAGRARWKTIKSPSRPTTHETTIELATKVTDTESKLRHTLAHELCHIAAWCLDGEVKPPHGGAFKLWAARIMQVRPDIEVTTTHSYEIVYKYRWKCTSGVCGKIFGRHSNSINTSTHGCPCGAQLVEIDKHGQPKKRTTLVLVEDGDGEGGGARLVETPKRKKSAWQEFVTTQSPMLRKERPTIPQSEVLKVLAEKWKLVKDEQAKSSKTFSSLSGSDPQGLTEALDQLHV